MVGRHGVRVETAPVIADPQHQLLRRTPKNDIDRPRRRVFCGVVERLLSDSIDGNVHG
jgi:hypothetical protein